MRQDLVGQKFDRLTVLEQKETTKHGNTKYKCLCICGKEVIVNGFTLVQPGNHSCGCGRYPRIEMVGKKFDRLSVIELADEIKNKNGKKQIRWLCKCDCGKTKIVDGRILRMKNVRSCGCLVEDTINLRGGAYNVKRRCRQYKDHNGYIHLRRFSS